MITVDARGLLMKMFKNLPAAVKKETLRVAVISYIGIAVMLLVFFLLNRFCPPKIWDVPFDYTVILGGVCCGIIDVLNFFFMGVAVNKVTSMEPILKEDGTPSDEDQAQARRIMSTSLRLRFLMMMLWGIAALTLPCFNAVAGVLPLVFPSLGIKLLGIANKV